MPTPAGFTALTASRLQDAFGNLLTGTLNVLPTDGNDQPIGTTAGGAGGPIAAVFASATVQTGVLAANTWVPDTSVTANQHISYRFVFKDATSAPILTWTGVQPTGATLNLDTYVPNLPTQSVVTPVPGPAGLVGGTTTASLVQAYAPNTAALVGATTTIHNVGTNLYDYTAELQHQLLVTTAHTDSTGTYAPGDLETNTSAGNASCAVINLITVGLSQIFINFQSFGYTPFGIVHWNQAGQIVAVDNNTTYNYGANLGIPIPLGTYRTGLCNLADPGQGYVTPPNQRMVSSSFALLSSYVPYTNPVVTSGGVLTWDCSTKLTQAITLADGQFIPSSGAGAIAVVNPADGEEVSFSITPTTANCGFAWPANFPGFPALSAANGNITPGLPALFKGKYDLASNTWRQFYSAAAVSAGTPRLVYTSQIPGVVSDSVITPGAAVTGADVHALIQPYLAGGNVHLVVNGCYTLAGTLIVDSNTDFEQLPGCGFVMAPGSNCEGVMNRHQNAPNVPSGAMLNGAPSGGMLVSNQVDHDITIRGGIWNMNSTGGAVTGTAQGVAHKSNPATGLWVNGFRLIGINKLNLFDFEMYDAATYSINHSNTSIIRTRNLYIHQPLPLVSGKNTDGLHTNGPILDIINDGNIYEVCDDAEPNNADDGQESRFSDGNGPSVQYPGVGFGPIVGVTSRNATFRGCATGYRFLSVTELIDQVQVSNARGITKGPALSAGRFYSASMGPGNFGSISVDNFEVTNGTSIAGYDMGCLIYLDGNFLNFSLSNLRMNNPTVANYLVWYIAGGTMQQLAFRDSRISNLTGAQKDALLRTDGYVAQAAISGLQWNGTSGVVLGGSTAPGRVTISNYDGPGPNRLLGFGTPPAKQNGDAFTNTY